MGKNNSLVYKLVLDVSKAVKSLDNFRNKAVRTTRDANTAMTQMEKGWRSPRSFGMAGMTHLTGSPMGARIKTTAAAGTTTAVADEAAKKLRLLGRVSDKLNTTLGMTSIKAMTLGGSFNALVTGLMKLNPVVVGLTLMFGKLMERTFHYGNIIAQSKMVLKSIWNSERRAVEAIKGMREFSRITQHSPEEVVGATTMLAKYNVDPFEKGAYGLAGNKNVMNLMSGLAAMPGMGGQPIGLDRAVNAAIAGRDVRPLKALGPEVIAAYDKARQAGMSGTPEYIKVMLEELAKVPKIMELANEQANQLSTMWSTITGYAEEFFMDISGAGEEKGVVTLWSQLEDILMVIRDEGEKFIIFMGPYLTEFGAALGSVFKFVWESVSAISRILGIVLVPAWRIFVEGIRVVFEVLKAVVNTFVQLVGFVIELLDIPLTFISRFLGINAAIENVVEMLRNLVLGLQITFMFLGIYLQGVFEDLKSFLVDFVEYYDREIKGIVVMITSMAGAWLVYKGAILAAAAAHTFMEAGGILKFITTLGKAIFRITGLTKLWTIAQGFLNAAIWVNPYTWIIVAVGLLAFAIYDLYTNWEEYSLNWLIKLDQMILKFQLLKLQVLSFLNTLGLVSDKTVKDAAYEAFGRAKKIVANKEKLSEIREGKEKSDSFFGYRKAKAEFEKQEQSRMDRNIKQNNYNTTINNYETQKVDFEKIKNMSGVVDIRNFVPGMRKK